MEEELRKYLKCMESGVVTKSRAGGGAGSIILMDIKNGSDPLYSLWIESTWRIENGTKVIATSADDIEAVTGLIAKSVKMLEGKTIKSIDINPFYDLCIHFMDDFCLKVFCIFSHSCECDVNWWFSVPSDDLYYVVTNHFEINKENGSS